MARNGNGTEKGFHVFATQAAYWVDTKWAFLAALLAKRRKKKFEQADRMKLPVRN